MKIVRDGKEFELTDPELADACREYARLCHSDDIESCLSEWCDENKIPREKIDSDDFNAVLDEYEEMLWYHEEETREDLAKGAIDVCLRKDDYNEE